mmetsp:Transcript_38988/g.70972  ORF Transcript_38988/g.70972 Transcript_38988/m.70972 type:complete len:158 (-) Transcript_38988:91-564(-)
MVEHHAGQRGGRALTTRHWRLIFAVLVCWSCTRRQEGSFTSASSDQSLARRQVPDLVSRQATADKLPKVKRRRTTRSRDKKAESAKFTKDNLDRLDEMERQAEEAMEDGRFMDTPAGQLVTVVTVLLSGVSVLFFLFIKSPFFDPETNPIAVWVRNN